MRKGSGVGHFFSKCRKGGVCVFPHQLNRQKRQNSQKGVAMPICLGGCCLLSSGWEETAKTVKHLPRSTPPSHYFELPGNRGGVLSEELEEHRVGIGPGVCLLERGFQRVLNAA